MKKRTIGLFLAVLALSACQKDVFDPNYNPKLGVTVPENFEWSTTKTLTVNVDVNDEYNGKYYYAVRVYDKAPGDGILPVAASGKVNKDMPFSQKIVIPATVSKLYVSQVFKNADASEKVLTKEVAINGEMINYSFGSSATRSVSTRADDEIELKEGDEIEKKGNYYITGEYTIGEIDDKTTNVSITVKAGGILHFATDNDLFHWTIAIDHGGKMTAADHTDLDLKNSEISNYGEVRIYDIDFENGSTLHNGDAVVGKNEGGCFYANKIEMSNGQGGDKRYLGQKSYLSCKELELDNVKLTFKTGAWLNCEVLDSEKENGKGAATLLGEDNKIEGTTYVGLATIGKIEGNLTIGNNVLVECKKIDGQITGSYVEDAKDKITIVGTACNDGFGNNEESELGTYTYIIEDMYPSEGDYDMNDIVASLTAVQQGTTLTIEGELKAAGAAYKLIPYITVGGTTQPLMKNNNNEALDAHTILGSSGNYSPINTIKDGKSAKPVSFTLTFEDVKTGLTMDDIDFFIEVGDQDIHWNTTNENKTQTWGMRIPGNEFQWPQEKERINIAYPNFNKWFKNLSFAWYI